MTSGSFVTILQGLTHPLHEPHGAFAVVTDNPDPQLLKQWSRCKVGERIEVKEFGTCTVLRIEFLHPVYEVGSETPIRCKRLYVELQQVSAPSASEKTVGEQDYRKAVQMRERSFDGGRWGSTLYSDGSITIDWMQMRVLYLSCSDIPVVRLMLDQANSDWANIQQKRSELPAGRLQELTDRGIDVVKLAEGAAAMEVWDQESLLPVSFITGMADETAKALKPQPACQRTGIHMVPVGTKKCQLCGKEIE